MTPSMLLDLAFLAVLAAGLLVGWFKGAFRIVAGVAGTVAGFLGGRILTPTLAPTVGGFINPTLESWAAGIANKIGQSPIMGDSLDSQANYSGYTVGQDTAFRRWSEACVRAALAVGGAFEMRYDPLHHEGKATLRRAWVALEDEALAALAPLAMLSQRIECVCEDGDCCVSVLFSFSRFSEQ